MAKVSNTARLLVAPRLVWQILGRFDGMPSWHPGVAISRAEEGGRLRRLTLGGGLGTAVERLESYDDQKFTYTYTLEEGPLPVTAYRATLALVPNEGKPGCTVVWFADFTPNPGAEAEAEAAIGALMETGLQNVQKMFGSP